MAYWEDVFRIIKKNKDERDRLVAEINSKLRGTGMTEKDVLELAKKIRRRQELEKRIAKLVKAIPDYSG
jgi:hypothetical protein